MKLRHIFATGGSLCGNKDEGVLLNLTELSRMAEDEIAAVVCKDCAAIVVEKFRKSFEEDAS